MTEYVDSKAITHAFDNIFSEGFFVDDNALNDTQLAIEDIDDEKLSLENKYKEAYKNNRISKCAVTLIEIYLCNADKFLRTVFITDCIKNPMGFKYSETDYRKTITILFRSLHLINQFKEIDSFPDFREDVMRLLHYTILFFNNNKSNTEMLMQNSFISLDLTSQLRMICVYIQDQCRLMEKAIKEKQSLSAYVTGMEMTIDNLNVDFADTTKTSMIKNFENLLELSNELIRFLFATSKVKNIVESNIDICPYEKPFFQEVHYIALQRYMLLGFESKMRYSSWKISKVLTPYNQEAYLLQSKYKEKCKAHLTAQLRRNYNLTTGIFNTNTNENESQLAADALNQLAVRLGCGNINISQDDKELFMQATLYCSKLILSFKSNMHPFYINCKFDGISMSQIVSTFEYLYTIGKIYITSVLFTFDEKHPADFQRLAPIVKIKNLYDNFAMLYDYPTNIAEKLISNFIFDHSIKADEGDIFSRPLISVAKDEVIFCESLISQMNLNRCVEMLLLNNNVDLSPIGHIFANMLIQSLEKSVNIKVNTNKIEFLAYDGRDVEFDFIGTFDDYLLLFEFKSVTVPYGEKEFFKKENTIKEGVAQVNRRCDIVQNDWDKISRLVNIDLPSTPYDKDKIIKLVCTNIFDFTSLEYDGVKIVDQSTLLKFFIDPFVEVVSIEKCASNVKYAERLWKGSQPTVTEFLSYLEKPSTIEFIQVCLKEKEQVYPCFKEDIPLAFYCLSVIEDPFKKIIETKLKTKKKTGRNETCFCNSGMKFKKCCGK